MAEKTCCVTGHRDIPEARIAYVEQELRREVEEAIAEGYTRFISGFAEGVDLMFAAIVAEQMEHRPELFLEAAIPYAGRLKTKNQQFQKLLRACKGVKVVCQEYAPSCFMQRNRYMAGESQRVIAVYDGRERGGTLFTMRVQDAFYSRCTKGYYMRGRTPYGFDTEPIVMDGIKTKKLVENAEMDFAELMFQMYAEPGNSYGDITRYFVKHSIKVYDKALQRGFISKLLRNPVYVQADMDIYEYYKAQGVKIESPPEMFTGDNSCYLYQGREGEEQILVIAPHQGRISSQLWLTVQRKLSQNTSFQNGRKCHNTWLAGKIKCGRCGYALAALRAQNGVTYLRCKQRAENGSCEGAGTLTAQSMEAFVYGEMVKKMQKFHTLKGGKEQSYNPKLTAARVALAKTESEIEKLLDTLSGANPLLLQYANNRIEELDAERQKQLRLVADLTANSVSASQIDSITGYLDDWESVSFDDKRKVVDILISQIDATSEEVVIHWKI